jgi:hypothetical protein
MADSRIGWRGTMMSWRRVAGRKDLIILFLVALAVRLIYLFLMVGEVPGDKLLSLAPDTASYMRIAHGMIGDGPWDEDSVIVFGPGYGFFLTLVFLLFGTTPYPVLVLQVVLSSLGCLLIYKLGKELTESKTVGLIAGYLSALSFTSISLANFILSDCLFFFLFLLGNVLFVVGLRRGRSDAYIASGVCIGIGALIRAIGQSWPIVMIALIFILPYERKSRPWLAVRLGILKRAYVAPLIALVIVGGWITRNYIHYGVPFLSFGSAGGPANVALITLAEIEHKDGGETSNEWTKEYIQATGDADISRADQYRILSAGARRTFLRYPIPMLKTHAQMMWENLNAENELYRVQVPRWCGFILDRMNWLHDRSLHYRGFVLTMIAFAVMLLFRRWRPLIFLGSIYSYFAIMIGVTRWQGSRLFYPGQIAWSIAIAFLFVTIGAYAAGLVRRLFNRQ